MTFYRTHFNFEDATRDYFPIFPLRALKPEPRREGQKFFFAVVFTCDTSGIKLFSVFQGLLSTLQSGARLNSYKDYLLKQESRLSAVGGLTINWGNRDQNVAGTLVSALHQIHDANPFSISVLCLRASH